MTRRCFPADHATPETTGGVRRRGERHSARTDGVVEAGTLGAASAEKRAPANADAHRCLRCRRRRHGRRTAGDALATRPPGARKRRGDSWSCPMARSRDSPSRRYRPTGDWCTWSWIRAAPTRPNSTPTWRAPWRGSPRSRSRTGTRCGTGGLASFDRFTLLDQNRDLGGCALSTRSSP